MSHPDDQKPDPAILRSMAEAQLARHPVTEPLPADALLHELQVHQVELEMQNEALRLAQTALEASRDRYVDLYDFAPVGYLTINSNGIIETLNLTATTLLGVARKDLLRRLFTTLVVAADQPCWMALFLFALKQDGKHNVEVTLQRGDGTVFPALLDCAAQKVGTGGTELRIALTDISERRRLEAELAREREHLEQMVFARTAELSHAKDTAEAANLAKTIFLANTGHELRTPMHGIIGMTDLVLHHLTDPKQIDWLTTSQKLAKQLMSTLDDIIDISRLESEALTLEEKNFSLAQTIDEVISMQAVPAEIKGLQLRREIDASLPALLCGDAMRMRQILVNFTSNAVKFSARGTIAVQVSVLEEDSISVMLKLAVSDQGIGISPAQQARLFQAFIQVDGSTRRKYSGNGVGLAICKRLALLMGGNAGVISQEGVGSTFWATARCKRAAPGAPCSKTAL